ncbi:Na+/H+ antiporter NhaA [Pseudoxanthomonas yeongjuensis]|uniref:Na+/H+ antiporter NhaA n=1 Tax=Pseudoxanthomonas yeongjuensis TaxID=377616 RepID=UPI0013913548|nr:Na+/H+ antiporter NhaA [Pseudoxanthomonas yeongjuensis]KAF1715975.1 Na+/H+ antiporter NhaA [Pseudoxanthomonas yeongjuensis]
MSRVRPVARAIELLRDFFRLQAAAGIVLMAAAALAMIVANSPWHDAYQAFRHLPIGFTIGGFGLVKGAEHWINDGLMAVFFLLVALEIKRETLSGQLSSREQMLLPVLCAIGGVAVPAILFWGVNHGDPVALRGWAIPTATDIAFALGVLALLGSRVPLGMKLLLSTIAVVDDLVAILIIAIFYTHDLAAHQLAWAGAGIGLMLLLNRRGVTRLWPYLLLGALVWYFVLKSGVHATLAGVVTGLLIPLRGKTAGAPSPLESLEHALHPWVAYLVLPLFAFANAGLALGGLQVGDVLAPVPLGIVLGLVLGKPVGIVAVALIARAAGIARFPDGMDFKAMLGLGMLCGVGFTMSLFISNLAYSTIGGHFGEASVLGVLCASVISASVGWVWLRFTLKPGQD